MIIDRGTTTCNRRVSVSAAGRLVRAKRSRMFCAVDGRERMKKRTKKKGETHNRQRELAVDSTFRSTAKNISDVRCRRKEEREREGRKKKREWKRNWAENIPLSRSGVFDGRTLKSPSSTSSASYFSWRILGFRCDIKHFDLAILGTRPLSEKFGQIRWMSMANVWRKKRKWKSFERIIILFFLGKLLRERAASECCYTIARFLWPRIQKWWSFWFTQSYLLFGRDPSPVHDTFRRCPKYPPYLVFLFCFCFFVAGNK